jgi:hypothetical protein
MFQQQVHLLGAYPYLFLATRLLAMSIVNADDLVRVRRSCRVA